MMSSERNVLTLIPYIILMTVLIGIYGYAFDDAIRKSNREISLLDIKNHSSIGILSIILPIVAILSILIRIIFLNIFESDSLVFFVINMPIIFGRISFFIGLIAVLGKNKDFYGIIGIFLSFFVSIFDFIL